MGYDNMKYIKYRNIVINKIIYLEYDLTDYCIFIMDIIRKIQVNKSLNYPRYNSGDNKNMIIPKTVTKISTSKIIYTKPGSLKEIIKPILMIIQ